MSDLLNHLKAENAKTQAWINEAPGRWAGMWSEDLNYWASVGVYTVEDLEMYNMQANYSDMYKDAYGFRPRHDTSSWTKEDWALEMERLQTEIEYQINEERAAEERAIEAFKSQIKEVIALGARDYNTALRWMTSEEQFNNEQDVEQWVYIQGLLFTEYGKEVVSDLSQMYGI